MICPICNKKRNPGEFERHHVIWRKDGGSNDPVNLLDICKTCHAIITRGCIEDRIPRETACFSLMLSRFGLTFLLKSNIIFSDHPLWGKAFVEKLANESAEEVDSSLLQKGREMYFKYTDQIIQGDLPRSAIPIEEQENKPTEAGASQ